VGPLTIPAHTNDDTALPGQLLDHYFIEDLVGRGGMADIFRATDLRTAQTVAIKVPHPEAENDRVFMQSFEREERILQTLDHPGIVRATREPGHSRPYMVMEWLEGRLLRDILHEQGKLPAERAVGIALSICNALEYIHRDGIIHRDLKPENIMVDAEDRAKIIDFGIALTVTSGRLTFSASSKVMGTPDYISPEQVKGKRADRRSDVYALGSILYEMLSGELPFPGTNPWVVMNARLLSDPPPLRFVNPAISRHLEEIVGRALEREPKKRYASVRAFASDLQNRHPSGVMQHRQSKKQRSNFPSPAKRIWFYVGLAMIPLLIFGMLLLEARRETNSTSSKRVDHSDVRCMAAG
jgi:serine/threonine protein kinase